ncbi:unnamed protein product, partial [Darwinula stevensoni]
IETQGYYIGKVEIKVSIGDEIKLDENHVIAERREKLKAIRETAKANNGAAFPNDFKPQHKAEDLHAEYGTQDKETLDPQNIPAIVAGRMMLKRVMGKASFATIQDTTGRIQLYIARDEIGEELYESFKHWDMGDILGASGRLMKTKTGELSLHVSEIKLLTKSLRPLPEKFHGLQDQEVKYRQRYVDLITSEETRATFIARSKVVSSIRNYMIENEFLEVETPMLHPIPGKPLDLSKPFQRLTIVGAIQKYAPEYTLEQLNDTAFLRTELYKRGIKVFDHAGLGSLQLSLFEETAESQLWEPTYIIDYPVEVSPLARASDKNPEITESIAQEYPPLKLKIVWVRYAAISV